MQTKSENYDVIVLGIGSMGSSALYYLASKGIKVLGLDQYSVPHDKGSHTGQTRLIRKAYYEHPDYVPLLLRSYENWSKLENMTGSKFYFETGILYMGKGSHPVMQGIKESASIHQIPINDLSASEEFRRHTPFEIPGHYDIILETEAGFVTPEKTISAYVALAKRHGAKVNTGEKVTGWEYIDGNVKVHTLNQSYTADKLVVTAGSYAMPLVGNVGKSLTVTKQWLAWFQPKNTDIFSEGRFPCWCIAHEDDPGIYYGFPYLDHSKHPGPRGMKVAHHSKGNVTNPDEDSNDDTFDEQTKLSTLMKRYLPGHIHTITALRSCYYTMSPDEHFILDHLEEYDEKVVIACGFSGHGFKFVPVIGEALSEMTLEGKTDLPVDFLKINRPGL